MSAANTGNLLGSDSLSRVMAASLPKDASPQLKSAYDAVALVSHATMISVGFRLVGLGEDHRIEAESTPDQPQPLPQEWNAQAPNYAFRYKHSQSSMEYLIKVNRMGNKAVIMGMGMGDDRTYTFDARLVDYISESNLPSTPVSPDASEDQASETLRNIFISVGRLSDLASLLRINIIQKLTPGLHKEGYEESSAQTSSSSSQRGPSNRSEPERPQRDPLREDYNPPARPHPFNDPLAAAPRRPHPSGDFLPPDFEDPYDMTRPPRPMGGVGGFGNIGERDLYPAGLGPNDPIRGGIGPGFGGGGGMHPTFDDPLFQGQGGHRGGYDPQAPPGSRYDPVGPGGAPRGSGGGGFRGGGLGGRPPNPFGGFGGGDFI